MTTHLSHKHGEIAIRLMYQQLGFEVSDSVPGDVIGNELGVNVKDAPFAALYAFIDEYIFLLRSQSIYFLAVDQKINSTAATFYRLSIRQLQTLTSIRTLCSYGLDTNARFQLRLLFETSLLWLRFRIDDDCLAEYSTCTSQKKANSFWHKHLSKGKTERYLKENMASKGFKWVGDMEDAIEEMKSKLSLVAHPTFLADYNTTLNDWNRNSDTYVVMPPSEISYFTLVNTILSAIIPFSVIPDPDYGFDLSSLSAKPNAWKPVQHPSESWQEYNQLLRNMFPALFLIALRFIEEFDEISQN